MAKKHKTVIPLAVIDRLMRKTLSDMKISQDAKVEFERQLVDFAGVACKAAKSYTTSAKRKTVKAEDVKAAFESMRKTT